MSRNQRWRQLRKSNRTWESGIVPVVGGLLAGTLLALTAAALDFGASAAALWAFLFGFLVVALPLVAVQQASARVLREVRALINIRPFTRDRLLAHDRWAMDALFAEQLLALVDEGRENIVELGSGHSTLLIARRLEAIGRGRLVAFDHLAEFAARTRGWIEAEGLAHRATVVHAPIEDRQVEGERRPWYSAPAMDPALPDTIDLLIVDGPPAKLHRDIRWASVPALQERLAPGAAILMDDGDRPPERRAAFDWRRRLKGSWLQYLPGGKGGWILRLPK